MPCPVCDGTAVTTVNVRIEQERDARQLAGSAWDGRNVARCDDCGVLYDHRLADDSSVDAAAGDTDANDAAASTESTPQRANCPECGALNDRDLDACNVCGTPLE